VPSGAVANTRILDAPTHGRAKRQPTTRSLIAIDGIAAALLLSRESSSYVDESDIPIWDRLRDTGRAKAWEATSSAAEAPLCAT
jgi:hypothetical protein